MSAATLRNTNRDLTALTAQLAELNDALEDVLPVYERARVARARNELLGLQRTVRSALAVLPAAQPGKAKMRMTSTSTAR